MTSQIEFRNEFVRSFSLCYVWILQKRLSIVEENVEADKLALVRLMARFWFSTERQFVLMRFKYVYAWETNGSINDDIYSIAIQTHDETSSLKLRVFFWVHGEVFFSQTNNFLDNFYSIIQIKKVKRINDKLTGIDRFFDNLLSQK